MDTHTPKPTGCRAKTNNSLYIYAYADGVDGVIEKISPRYGRSFTLYAQFSNRSFIQVSNQPNGVLAVGPGVHQFIPDSALAVDRTVFSQHDDETQVAFDAWLMVDSVLAALDQA